MSTTSEKEALSILTALSKDKSARQYSVADAERFLQHPCDKVKAKALWVLGEIGLQHPALLAPYAEELSEFLSAQNSLLRERALNALGRIGRGDHHIIEPYLSDIKALAADTEPPVRLAFIWACENIATNAPRLFEKEMPLFVALLDDENDRVRIEAPEMFRVLGRRIPNAVMPYRARLLELSENDENRVVRIHAASAVRAMDGSK